MSRCRRIAALGLAIALALAACTGPLPQPDGAGPPSTADEAAAASDAGPTRTSDAGPLGASGTRAPAHWGRAFAQLFVAEPGPWVVFEEVEPEPLRWPILERVRVPQADTDTKGAGFWFDPSLAAWLEAEGIAFDEFFAGRHVIADGEGRWRVDDECAGGVHGTTHRTRQQALQAAVRDRASRTLPYGALPLGLEVRASGRLGCEGIKYAGPESLLDEVRVLPETVAVTGGTLRGLLRNWSRTLWAWDVHVHMDGRVYRWPLTIQPGENAAFEISDWSGPADATTIEFDVAAEMSNEADLSRGFEFSRLPFPDLCPSDREPSQGGLAHPGYGVPLLSEVLDDFSRDVLERECLRYLSLSGVVRHRPYPGSAELDLVPSHPSMHGRLAPGLIKDLRAYIARLDTRGRVVDLQRLTPFNKSGPVVDLNGEVMLDGNGEERWTSESVTREYPPLDGGIGLIGLYFRDPSPDGFVIWVGGAHLRDE